MGGRGARRLQLGVGIAERREVGRTRTRVELLEQAVVAFELLQLRDAAFRIIEIAEDDGVGRARRGARRHDLAVADLAILALGVDARVVDPLHAVGALLLYTSP